MKHLESKIYCLSVVHHQIAIGVPGREDVNKALVSVEFRGDVFFDPLVDGLWRGIYFDLFQKLLF